jgi:hypothetical protein
MTRSALVVHGDTAYMPAGGNTVQGLHTVFWVPPHWTAAYVGGNVPVICPFALYV